MQTTKFVKQPVVVSVIVEKDGRVPQEISMEGRSNL